MLKPAFATILVTGLVSVGPAFAETNSGGIGRGCTLDPFTKTMRCVDFDNCTTDKNGKKTCPVVVTPYGMSSTGGGSQSNAPQLFESANATFVSRF